MTFLNLPDIYYKQQILWEEKQKHKKRRRVN